MENAGNTPNASMEPFQYLASHKGPSRLRRWLMSLVALLGLITAAIVVIGLIPFAPDPAGLTNGNPGGGGLRRAFPEMKMRPSNQTTQEKVELGRLLYFDPVLSGDNEQSCATPPPRPGLQRRPPYFNGIRRQGRRPRPAGRQTDAPPRRSGTRLSTTNSFGTDARTISKSRRGSPSLRPTR